MIPAPAMDPADIDSYGLRRQQMMALILLVVGYAGFYLCRADLSVITPLLLKDFAARGVKVSSARERIGWIISIGTLAYAIGKFIAGVVGDLGGGRRTFLIGMSGAVLFTALFTFGSAGAVPIFTLAWVGNRLLQSFGWPGMMKIAGRTWPFQSYGLVAAILSLSFLFGDAAARAFMGWLLSLGFGWRAILWIDAAALASWLIVTLLLLQEKPRALGAREFPPSPGNLYKADDFTMEEEPRKGVVALLKPLVTSLPFMLVCVLSLAMTFLREVFGNWTPTYFTEMLHLTDAAAARSSAYFPLLGGLSVIIAGWFSDRLHRGGRAIIIAVGLVLSGAVLFAIGNVRAGQATLGVSLVALTGFLLIGPYSYLAGAIALDFGGSRGAASACGIIDGVGYFAGILAGYAAAWFVDHWGYSTAFRVLALVAWSAAGVSVWFWYTQHSRLHVDRNAALS